MLSGVKMCNRNKIVSFLFSLILILLCSLKTNSQNNIGIKYFGLSIHPKGEKANARLMPRRFDKDGYLVLNVGGIASYEKFLFEHILSVKTAVALYSDCAAQLGGFAHVGVRAKIFKTGKHSLYGGIGPTLVFRDNWQRLDAYVNLNRFKGDVDVKWQYLFLWYGGEFEYKYSINDKMDFAVSFVPGYPDLMSLSLGVHYKFSDGK